MTKMIADQSFHVFDSKKGWWVLWAIPHLCLCGHMITFVCGYLDTGSGLIAGMTPLHDFSILLFKMEDQTYFPPCQMQD